MNTNHDHATNNQNPEYYVLIDGQKVPLTPEQRKAWLTMINDVRRQARKAGTCGQPDFRKCCGDCGLCPWQTEGLFVYMDDRDRYVDGFAAGSLAPANPQMPIDREYEEKDMWERLYSAADDLVQRGEEILRMAMEEGLSSHEISRRTGIAKSTVVDRMNKLLGFIREHREDFI